VTRSLKLKNMLDVKRNMHPLCDLKQTCSRASVCRRAKSIGLLFGRRKSAEDDILKRNPHTRQNHDARYDVMPRLPSSHDHFVTRAQTCCAKRKETGARNIFHRGLKTNLHHLDRNIQLVPVRRLSETETRGKP
jgi:hypothetical protein